MHVDTFVILDATSKCSEEGKNATNSFMKLEFQITHHE